MDKNKYLFTSIQSYETDYNRFIDSTHDLDKFPQVKQDLDFFIHLLSGKYVLDVGFGSGRDIKYFLSKELQVEGVELCKNFITALQKKIKNVNLYHADIRHLKLETTYNGIWCCAILLHLDKQDFSLVLRNFHSILSKDGILYISVKEGNGTEWCLNNHVAGPRYFFYYSLPDVLSILKSEGFLIKKYNNDNNWISVHAEKV